MVSLDKFLRSKYSDVEIVAECEDGSSLETKNLDDILVFENTNFRKIHGLVIDAKNDYSDKLSITLRRPETRILGTAGIDLRSEIDEKAVFIVEEVVKRLKEMKPSYDWITRIDFTLSTFVILGIPGLVLATLRLFDMLPPSPPSRLSTAEGFNVALVLVGLVFVITYPIRKGIDYLFPKVFYMLGKQKKTFEIILKWRNFIFIGIILAIATGVIGNALSQQLLGK